jgi:hypothetical protein
MDTRTLRDVAAAVAAGAGVLLLADLSIGWHEVEVTAGGVVDITATSSGWSGIGLVAGLLTIALLVAMIRPLRGDGSVAAEVAATTAAIGVAILGFTIAAALTGSASVDAPAASVEVGAHLWPAYAGVALAAIVAGGTVTALALVLRGATAPSRATHATG